MARLAAVERALYYPTPLRVIDLIAQIFQVGHKNGRILDVCAGEGSAVELLARWWGLTPYGVELDGGRAALAAQKFRCLHGSYHQLKSDEGKFQALFLNPPYDWGEKDGVSSRQEVQFLMDVHCWLAPYGLLVFIPPRMILKSPAFRDFMQRNYQNIRCWAFPSPEVEAFNQVVVVAQRKPTSHYYHYGNIDEITRDNLPALEIPSERIPIDLPYVSPGDVTFELSDLNPYDIAPRWGEGEASGAYASRQWDLAMREVDRIQFHPLVAPRPGHQAMLLAGGALDGAQIGDMIIKGGSEKITIVDEEDNGEDGKVRVEREQITSRLSVLDLQTGLFESWRADDDPTRTEKWFQSYGEGIADAIRRSYAPSFNGDLTPYMEQVSRYHAPGVLPGREKPEFLVQQIEAASATAFWWKRGEKTVLLSGEMGLGKSVIAILAGLLSRGKKIIVMCPSHLVPKWIRECEKVTGQPGIAVTAKKLSEVDAFFAKPQEAAATSEGDDLFELLQRRRTPRRVEPRFLILSKEMAKLGSRWEPAFRTRKTMIEREVVDTSRSSSYRYSYGYSPPMKKVKMRVTGVACPDCGHILKGDLGVMSPQSFPTKTHISCPKCSKPMWQTAPLSAKGTKRWPLARYINSRYKRRYHLILDECFPGDTMVDTACGLVPIKEVKVGDHVWSQSKDGRLKLSQVIRHIPKRLTKPLIKVIHERGAFVCTPEHKIWTTNRGYVEALYLTNTDALVEITRGLHAHEVMPNVPKDFHVCASHTARTENMQSPLWGGASSAANGTTERKSHCDVPGDVRVVPILRNGNYEQAQTSVLQPILYSEGCLGKQPNAAAEDLSMGQNQSGLARDSDGDPSSRASRVLTVEPVSEQPEWVYDLEVEDTHCYFANGVLVSNCHQYAKADSDQSRAAQHLCSGAKKILAMTGTIYGGRASSIFHLLYKISPEFRLNYAYDEMDRFVGHHGLFEKRIEEDESTSRYGYKRGGGTARVKEIPGMSPAMIPVLLPFSLFIKLKDLRLELPPYEESVELIDHEPEIHHAATKLQGDVRSVLREHPQILGAYLMACLGYPDCPEQEEEIVDKDQENETETIVATAPAFDRHLLPKDLRVIEIVKAEKELGRQVLVYFSQTHRRDARHRVREGLEAEGLRVKVLDANVAADKREAWLAKAAEEGFDVLLTNGRLVETGMDLLFAATIIQYGTEYSIPSLRQSIRRSWRLGQAKPIKVIFLGYRGTMQDVALKLIARKMRAAEMVDGDEMGGLSQHDETGSNFFVELAHEAVTAVLNRAQLEFDFK